ncbi:hypothetical protein KUCAC02_003887 [Chaenocephalus aceratus]|uniref:Uncharacterized protein n=1 Tax=Chaenocephalus aceratus TaxID=36190 RepID=A0ACB9WLV4_CHAAC|nr:hypothetical protein KUCAC02_003887 [Chaenocephalus aceratus]
MEAPMEHREDSQTMRNQIVWSDETKCGLNAKHHVWKSSGTAHHLANTTPTVKHGGCSFMLWDVFQQQELGD